MQVVEKTRWANIKEKKSVKISSLEYISGGMTALFVLFLVWIKLTNKEMYWVTVQEDGFYENLTVLFLFLASVTAAGIAFRFFRVGQRFYGMVMATFTAILLVAAFEEVSWGQRIFHFLSPEFFARNNQQHEVNLHNFASRHPLHFAFILISGAASFAWIAVPRFVPRSLHRLCDLILPGRTSCAYFLPTLAIYMYYEFGNFIITRVWGQRYHFDYEKGYNFFLIARDQEPAEAWMAVGIFAFLAVNLWRQSQGYFDAVTQARSQEVGAGYSLPAIKPESISGA